MELLVAVAVIGVLSGLLIAVVSHTRDTADSMRCNSNMRNIAAGIVAYANEHDSTLPGPLQSGQWGGSWDNDRSQLRNYLYPYLSYKQGVDTFNSKANAATQNIEISEQKQGVFYCPTYAKKIPKNQAYNAHPYFCLNIWVSFGDPTKPEPPFGFIDSRTGYRRTIQEERQPKRLADLAEIVDEKGIPAASRTWMMKDIDQLDPVQAGGIPAAKIRRAQYFANIPAKPVHGDYRNAIFFDFHGGKVDLNDVPR